MKKIGQIIGKSISVISGQLIHIYTGSGNIRGSTHLLSAKTCFDDFFQELGVNPTPL
jgi:hypothetical protein